MLAISRRVVVYSGCMCRMVTILQMQTNAKMQFTHPTVSEHLLPFQYDGGTVQAHLWTSVGVATTDHIYFLQLGILFAVALLAKTLDGMQAFYPFIHTCECRR